MYEEILENMNKVEGNELRKIFSASAVLGYTIELFPKLDDITTFEIRDSNNLFLITIYKGKIFSIGKQGSMNSLSITELIDQL